MMFGSSIHDLLVSEGYRLVEDAWQTHGRRTYLHDENADRSFVRDISRTLRGAGWLILCGLAEHLQWWRSIHTRHAGDSQTSK
jgi:hypothetical protein